MNSSWKTYYMTNDYVLELLSSLKKCSKGEKDGLKKVIVEQLSYLIYKRVGSYRSKYFYNDLVQEGKVGLLKSLEDFDSTRGINFFKFAIWHIQCRIRMYLKYQQRFEKGKSKEKAINTFMPSPQESLEKIEIKKVLKNALYKLPDLESKVVMMRFGICGSTKYTLQQIGDMFSVSKQYVKQVESQAICRLRRDRDIIEFYKEERLWS